MSFPDVPELSRILSGFSMTSIAQMKMTEKPSTSLKSVKRFVDHARQDQLALIFRPELSKASIWQILNWVYENDRPLFDLLFLFLSSLPPRLENVPSTGRVLQFRSRTESHNVWETISIHPLFRYPPSPPEFSFEPRFLASGENRFTLYLRLNGTKYYVIFGSATTFLFHVTMVIGSTTVLRADHPASNFPLERTSFLSEGYNSVSLANKGAEDEIAFAVMPLVHVSDLEIEVDIMSRKPYLNGGSVAFCPISHEIIELPVRGIACAHTDNIDLQAYVRSSELSRNWTCPICRCPLPYEELYLDGSAYNEIRDFVLDDPLSFFVEDPKSADV
jgi:hypothetical protein